MVTSYCKKFSDAICSVDMDVVLVCMDVYVKFCDSKSYRSRDRYDCLILEGLGKKIEDDREEVGNPVASLPLFFWGR